jgi:tetratricopeptide (TPR) repeat protein
MIETKKAHELDIVELTEDLLEFGLRRGMRGTVVEVLDNPEEAYLLEFSDESGVTSKLAYGVKPEQIQNIDLIAKEFYVEGMALLQEGNHIEAARKFRQAVNLIPSYIKGLHESFRQSLVPHEDWSRMIVAMQFVSRIDPNYEFAKNNLAIAFLNYGVQKANNGNYEVALSLFECALRVESSSDIMQLVRENISTSHTVLGTQAYENFDFPLAMKHLETAYTFNSNERTRHDIGVIYFRVADFYVKKGDFAKAKTFYQWALDTGLMLAEVLNNYGCALAESGNTDEAVIVLESAQALSPDDEVINFNLSKLIKSTTDKVFKTETLDINFHPAVPMHTVELSLTA